MTKRTLDKARRELEQGNLWRAKEILQGAIRNENYDGQLYEMMGTVLLRMGDLPEAGRFLFLSGLRRPEYLEAIEMFLSRHRPKKPEEFFHVLPRRARLKTVSEYPAEVAQVLREIGFHEIVKDEEERFYQPRDWKDVAGWITCGTIAFVVVGLLILGALKFFELIR